MQHDLLADTLKLDFEQAKAKHLLFRSRLRSLLYGSEIDKAPIISHETCPVGEWIYTAGLRRYAHIPEMHLLEETHIHLHQLAGRLVHLYGEGKVDEARKGLPQIEKEENRITDLLEIIEKRARENPGAVHGLKELEKENGSVSFRELDELQRLSRDLDQRIREQTDELFEAKERFELVAQATKDAIWDWNLQTGRIWWNEGFRKLFGYPEDQVESGIESWSGKIHHEDRLRIWKDIQECIRRGDKQWSAEYRYRKADGTYAVIFDRGYVLYDTAGKPHRMVGAMVDITEDKKAAESLEQKIAERTRELKAANEQLKQFAYAASHDLKEPLRKITFFLDRLMTSIGPRLEESDHRIVERIQHTSGRMQGLIDDLLSYSNTSLGTTAFVRVDLRAVVGEVLDDIEASVIRKCAQIDSDNLPSVPGDYRQLRQLFHNLISNAVKYSQPGKAPRVRIRSHSADRELICSRIPHCREDARFCHITVEDEGIGFAEEDAERIFGLFQRLHGRAEYEGTGIGLAICRKVAENHGGAIWAHSKPGEGTVFHVLLPSA